MCSDIFYLFLLSCMFCFIIHKFYLNDNVTNSDCLYLEEQLDIITSTYMQ